MAGLNVIFDEDEYIDHGNINREWFGPLDEGHSGWICTIRLVEVPLGVEDENLFVVLKEEDRHTELESVFIGPDPRSDSNEEDREHVGGGYRGGHIREDGCLSLGTPYKAFSVSMAYLGTYLFLNGECGLRVDRLPDGQEPEEFWPGGDSLKKQGDARARRLEYERAIDRVSGETGREVRHNAVEV